MRLELSRDSVTNAVVSLDVRPIYHIHTPVVLPRKTTTIYKIPEATARLYEEAENKTDVEPDPQEEIARIHWHAVHNSTLIYEGRSVEIGKFLEPKGLLGHDKIFTGPDDKPYKWSIGFFTCTLTLNDGSKPPKVVAQLHPWNLVTRKKPCLEVDESVSSMLDLIVVTLVFVETQRRDAKGILSMPRPDRRRRVTVPR